MAKEWGFRACQGLLARIRMGLCNLPVERAQLLQEEDSRSPGDTEGHEISGEHLQQGHRECAEEQQLGCSSW